MKVKKVIREDTVTQDILSLVGIDVPLVVLTKWTDKKIEIAENYASLCHLKASDNHVKVPKMPRFLMPYREST